MKKVILVVLAGLFAIGYVSCTKPEPDSEPKKDYREKWVGEYVGEYIYEYYGEDNPHSDTTRDAVINVAVLKDSFLLITFVHYQWEPRINTNGLFGQYDDAGISALCEGAVLYDSIYFGGLLTKRASGYDFKGKKIAK